MENSWGTRMEDLIPLYSQEIHQDAVEIVYVRVDGGLDQGGVNSGNKK